MPRLPESVDDDFESAEWDEGFEDQAWEDLMVLGEEASARATAVARLYGRKDDPTSGDEIVDLSLQNQPIS